MRCVVLREGGDEPLFLFPGLGGEAGEFTQLVRAMRTGRRVLAIELVDDTDGGPNVQSDRHVLQQDGPPPTLQSMANEAIEIIKRTQAQGPYYLAGYSFGGLVMLEVARALRTAGSPVAFAGLLDSIYDRRYWPLRLFVAASVRRSARHLARLARRPSVHAWPDLWTRSGRLIHRIGTRLARSDNGAARQGYGDEADDPAMRNGTAMAGWQPRPVDGRVVMFTSSGRDDFGCEPAKLWRPWVDDLEVHRVPGSHRGMMTDVESVRALALALDDALVPESERPLRVLLATTFAWESSYALAAELAAAAYVVEAVAPPKSDLHRMECVTRSYRLGVVRPITTLRRAIESSTADLVIPLDDRTRQSLQEIFACADASTGAGALIRERIQRSLGAPEHYGCLYSRAVTMGMAADRGLRCPPTSLVTSIVDVRRWMDEHRAPAVLKTDGSWGGREVVVAHDTDEAIRAFERLSRFPRWRQIAKRWVVDRDPWALRMRLRRRRPVVSIQAYIDGTPANVATACLEGRLLGAVKAEALSCAYPLGPSTMVRVIEHPEMRATAEAMVHALGVTGFCGFDFVLESSTRRAFLIEVNPRATPTAHLVSASGDDLLARLRCALGRPGPSDRTHTPQDSVVDLSTNLRGSGARSSALRVQVAHTAPAGAIGVAAPGQPPASAATVHAPRLRSRN